MNDELAATDADIARLDAYIDRLRGALGHADRVFPFRSGRKQPFAARSRPHLFCGSWTGVSFASYPNARSTLEVAFSAVPTQTSDERCSQQGSSRQGFDGKLSTKMLLLSKSSGWN